MTYPTTVTKKGQVTIPAKIREYLNIKPSSKVIFVKDGKSVKFLPYGNFLDLGGSIKSKKVYSDSAADKAVGKFIAKQYEKEITSY